MTTKQAAKTIKESKAVHADSYVRLPDRPEPDDVNNNVFLHIPGNSHHLAMHFGNEDTTIVMGEGYISRTPTSSRLGLFHPDLLIAFDVNPPAVIERNGYIISEQGKPPDFVMEIASRSTARRDVTVKRDGYAALSIPEYWRFDNSGGRHHGAPLAGDHLVNGAYQPIPIERIDGQTHQGYSAVLDLYLRWEEGKLGWYDPATERHIIRFSDERDRADTERDRADAEQEARIQAQTQASTERAQANAEREARIQAEASADTERAQASAEREARIRAEARIRELEAELQRRRQP